MKNYLLFITIFYGNFAFSQLNETFVTNALTWTGSNAGNDFIVTDGQLRSNSINPNSNFYLSTASTLANNCQWEFWVNLQFSTSGSNYVDVYLIANQSNLQSPVNGYFVRIGNTDDEISLFKRTGSLASSVKLIDGSNGSLNLSNNKVKIRVNRSADNTFTLERDITGSGIAYVTEGTLNDGSFTSSSFFGIFVQQSTSTFHQKHFFDDIKISSLITDTSPPKLLSATALDSTTIEIIFDEPVDSISAKNTANYTLNNQNPVSVKTSTDASRFLLKLSTALHTASHVISAANVADKSGNLMNGNSIVLFSYVKPFIAKKGDLVINEIFADPSPQVDLPSVEFIEIVNTASHTIQLKNWKYSDPTSTATLPADSIKAGEYIILCAKADTSEFKPFGKTIGISPWPSLNNSADVLKLLSPENRTIDSVAYADSWHVSPTKKQGGWSLERIDYLSVCTGLFNWTSSPDASGGTPGKQNAISNAQQAALKMEQATLTDSVTITVRFNRLPDNSTALNAENYSAGNGLGKPMAVIANTSLYQVDLKYAKPIARGNSYRVMASAISDCSGQLISDSHNSAEFFYPHKIAKNDILISEILFNPRSEGADFVEIYNNSSRTFDLKELSIAAVKAPDSIVSRKNISLSPFLFKPETYLVLSVNPDNIKKEYRTENTDAFLTMPSMPAFNNDAGTVVLLSADTRIDQFSYTENMHFSLIKDPKGVSLERSNFSIQANERGNFRSAAAAAGYATPGYKNSQFIENANDLNTEVSLLYKTFSPDNDGFEDALQINYRFTENEMVANVNIYNDRGTLVRRLAKNVSISAEGSFFWDGFAEDAQKVNVGIYIVTFEVFSLNGHSKKFRRPCVLAAKLN